MFHIPTVLFIGTANRNRSRIAEALFNHRAEERGLGWCAISRGLAVDTADGALPAETRRLLETRGVALHHTATASSLLTTADLRGASIIVALDETEHRPLIENRFPDWTAQVNFWDAGDTRTSPEDTHSLLEPEIDALLAAIEGSAIEP